MSSDSSAKPTSCGQKIRSALATIAFIVTGFVIPIIFIVLGSLDISDFVKDDLVIRSFVLLAISSILVGMTIYMNKILKSKSVTGVRNIINWLNDPRRKAPRKILYGSFTASLGFSLAYLFITDDQLVNIITTLFTASQSVFISTFFILMAMRLSEQDSSEIMTKLDNVDTKLDKIDKLGDMDTKLDKIDEKIGAIVRLLGEIRDNMPSSEKQKQDNGDDAHAPANAKPD